MSDLYEKVNAVDFSDDDDMLDQVEDEEAVFAYEKENAEAIEEEDFDIDEFDDLLDFDDDDDDDLDEDLDLTDVASDDTVGLYLKEMARVPLLTNEEEISLAMRLEQGYLATEQLNNLNGDATEDERDGLLLLIEDGRNAREHLIKANTRLVVSIAKRYMSRGVPFLDLIQEGNLGLMKAVEKFDYRRGYRFSTYATWWIRQFINRSISNHGSLVRLPSHKREYLYRAKVKFREMAQEKNRDPHPWEMLEALSADLSEQEAEEVVDLLFSPTLIETMDHEQASMTDHDSRFEDTLTPRPDHEISLLSRDGRIMEFVEKLGEREQYILIHRYGLSGDDPHAIKDIAEHLGLTRERIRQLHNDALNAIRDMMKQSGEEARDYIQT